MFSPDTQAGGIVPFIALVTGISIAVERMVEMLKAGIPILGKEWKTHDPVRAGILQLLAAIGGGMIAWQIPDQVKSVTPGTFASASHAELYAFVGLLSSAGSGVWNRALAILGALKAKQEEAVTAESFGPPVRRTLALSTALPAVLSAPVVASPARGIAPQTAMVTAGSGPASVAAGPAAGAKSPTITIPAYSGRVIAMGDTDADLVRSMQKRLNQLGCGPVAEDGSFGPATQAAVELFQIRSADNFGLPLIADGRVGPLTWSSLFAVPQTQTTQTASTPLLRAVLSIASGEVGVREEPLGSNRGPRVDQYLRAVGIDPSAGSFPWCAAFVYWCFQQAAQQLTIPNPVIKTGSVAEHWLRAGSSGILRITAAECSVNPSLVAPGIIFVIMNSAGTGHTGLVEKIDGSYLTTIEGNTNDNGSREGFGVFRRTKRRIADINRGFIIY